ncbi:MAG TPA: agmatine deiminase family protein [Methanomicrobiales archaeon]|nr:agmatine deiminase family protein [Methanomicrobiales archaeon]
MTRIGLIQMRVSEDPADNLARGLAAAGTAVRRGAEILCLPELYRTRYFPQTECSPLQELAETIPGESTRAFSAFAREHGVVVIVPVFEEGEAGAYHNTAVVIDRDGGILPPYRKVHVPHDPLFYERHYFVPGDGYRVYETAAARFAVLVCYDQWFPEPARAVSLRGAEIIFYPTAIGWPPGEGVPPEGDWSEAWETVQRAHAIANGVHVAAVNRAGQEGELLFWGGSFVADAFGNVIGRAGEEEEVLVVDLDLSLNRAVRDGWGFLRNRRPDTYGILTEPVLREYPGSGGREDTPKRMGFTMPAEWEPHEATWLAWPHEPDTFADIPAVGEAYIRIISALVPGERVNLLVRDEDMEDRIRGLLSGAGIATGQVSLIPFDYADVWFRDYGPSFVVNRGEGKAGMVGWGFNAWGGKYPGMIRDTRIPSCLQDRLGLPLFRPGIVLEGGSIDVNGRGTVLTTEQCLLSPNRNPGLSKADLEGFLGEFLGAPHVIWLEGGIAGDDTDGHIDDVARFVNPSTVVCAVEKDAGDENYRALRENERILRAARDQDGNPLTVIPLPMPRPTGDGARLPASFLNFYIGNRAVLVPVFSDPADARALRILGDLFPGREVVGIDCRALVEGMGAIHCITREQPATR